MTSHDAFQYFGGVFSWRLQAIQGLSTEDEAGVGDIQETVDFVIEHDIPVLFVESSVPPDTIEAVIEAVRAQGRDVRIGLRELFGDAMAEADAFGGTYIGMLALNALTIMQSYQLHGRRCGDRRLAPGLAADAAGGALECGMRRLSAVGVE